MKKYITALLAALLFSSLLQAGKFFCPAHNGQGVKNNNYLNQVVATWIFMRDYNTTSKLPASKHLVVTCHYSDSSKIISESKGTGAQRYFDLEQGGDVIYEDFLNGKHYPVTFACFPDEDTESMFRGKGLEYGSYLFHRSEGGWDEKEPEALEALQQTAENFSRQCGLYSTGGGHEGNRKNLWTFLCSNEGFSDAHSIACGD